MLRWALLIFALALIGGGLVSLVLPGTHPSLSLLISGVVVVLAVLCERWRYRRIERSRGDGEWQKTGECFEDPETGLFVEVLYDPVSGERRYEPMDNRP